MIVLSYLVGTKPDILSVEYRNGQTVQTGMEYEMTVMTANERFAEFELDDDNMDDSNAYTGGLVDQDGYALYVGDTVIVELSPGEPESVCFVEIEWVDVAKGFVGGITRNGDDWTEKSCFVQRV